MNEQIIIEATNNETGTVWTLIRTGNELQIINGNGIQDAGMLYAPDCLAEMLKAFARCVGDNSSLR